jgi:hypothetical protein
MNSRLFCQLCADLDSENTALLLHNEVRWLSHGNVLCRLSQVRGEVHLFLRDMLSLAKIFEDEEWLCKCFYLTDIFQKLNELNLALQGFGNHIFSMQDKITAFYRKLFLWPHQANTGNYATFCTLTDFMEQNDESTLKQETQEHIIAYLERMRVEFETYFPFLTTVSDRSTDWICLSLSMDAISKVNLCGNNQDHLIDIMSDHRFQRSFKEKSSQFWMEVKNEYPEVGNAAITSLLPFGSTYLCEKTFSAMVVIKSKQRNCLQLELDLVFACQQCIFKDRKAYEQKEGPCLPLKKVFQKFRIFIIA